MYLNDSFRTIQEHNDSFRDMFRNVISLTLLTCTSGEMLMTHNIRSETTRNDPFNGQLPLRLSSMVALEMSNVLGKTLY
jgi:hypothetical protein